MNLISQHAMYKLQPSYEDAMHMMLQKLRNFGHNIFTSCISGRGNIIGTVCLFVYLHALSQLNIHNFWHEGRP